MLTLVDLFSGIGGFSLAAHWTGKIRTTAFSEIDPFCCKVLEKNFPGIPNYGDITGLRGEDLGPTDIISGGFPCQPFSVAGKQRGQEDDRHLWPEMFRVIQEVRPRWVFGENVAGIILMGIDEVLSDLEGAGYDTQAFVIPACAVDAPHRRDRVWIMAHATADRLQRGRRSEGGEQDRGEALRRRSPNCGEVENDPHSVRDSSRATHGEDRRERERGWEDKDLVGWNPVGSHARNVRENVAHADLAGLQTGRAWSLPSGEVESCGGTVARGGFWMPEPNVGRVADGVPSRVDRLKALGNAIVPQVAYRIFEAILKEEQP